MQRNRLECFLKFSACISLCLSLFAFNCRCIWRFVMNSQYFHSFIRNEFMNKTVYHSSFSDWWCATVYHSRRHAPGCTRIHTHPFIHWISIVAVCLCIYCTLIVGSNGGTLMSWILLLLFGMALWMREAICERSTRAYGHTRMNNIRWRTVRARNGETMGERNSRRVVDVKRLFTFRSVYIQNRITSTTTTCTLRTHMNS